VRRSPVLCGVGFGFYVPVRRLTQDNKEKNIWWTYPQGGGEPHTCCVSLLCAMY
jgi:hypothetical protein